MADLEDATAFPLVAFASTVQFAPGERPAFPRVSSRMILASAGGAGRVEVDGTLLDVVPGTILVLPWNHAVRYLPDPDDPYVVYGAHLIPHHDADVPVELAVPHDGAHPLSGASWRSDAVLGIGSGLVVTDDGARPVLMTLAKLVAQVWDRGEPSVDVARALGVLLVAELDARGVLPQHDRDLPLRLRRALTWITADLSREIGLPELAAAADCSPSTVTRLFRTHLGCSPMSWVLDRRMDEARRLLSTTTLPVQQVARRVGVADGFYFSRVFHQRTGLSPTQWRERRSAP
ncbi:transcriptional regulator, AraC family [Beutenbergia cavernae DSM 12333]|uniref:Transcriptional regulator, AraC family n=1 Tax=Beutenbergia cavernae (strain ATCC BAA-8 / DSM 12333 / CCUG 43141 / JCM 11478 / NBRC 16432 / NCIMB 13614 / HKI 0122) TaxID=471853 RepID=C5BZM5_BEUC1|nr:AraC family transcriptional regulator [Beutenbergia cavernae]ACQ79197.1 transcriptional regulator, AraC family [Beutenbergia cavernae DSM 12333]